MIKARKHVRDTFKINIKWDKIKSDNIRKASSIKVFFQKGLKSSLTQPT